VDLEPAAPYEVGDAGGFINYLYPAYVRGPAYLLARKGTAAAIEFQKLVEHRGTVGNFLTGSICRLLVGPYCEPTACICRTCGAANHRLVPSRHCV